MRGSSVSLPSWERGLKLIQIYTMIDRHIVAPFVGAWIEITKLPVLDRISGVAPLVGAWIEIVYDIPRKSAAGVAPLVGA